LQEDALATDQLYTYFNAQSRKHKEAARAIFDKADEEGREITPEEKAEAEMEMDQFKEYSAKANKHRDNAELRRQLEEETGQLGNQIAVTGVDEPIAVGTIGDMFVKSGVFKAMHERKKLGRLGQNWMSDAVELPWDGVKAAAMPVLESGDPNVFGNLTSTTGAMRTLIQQPTTPSFLFARLTVADLIPSIQVAVGNSVIYPKLVSRDAAATELTLTGASWGIAEGNIKNPIGYEWDVETVILRKLAAYTKMSEEFVEDAPALAAWINADLGFNIRQAEEVYLTEALYASVTDASALAGSSTNFDDVMAAITVIREAGGEPDGMLISATNWAELVISKFGTGAGDKLYVGGGPFSTTDNPWGLRVVITPNAHDDHPLVGDFRRGAKIFRKGGLSVQGTNTDQDDFVKNLVTIRAEERLAVIKQYPELFKLANLT
jgi:HK97 family phage major capsid protein